MKVLVKRLVKMEFITDTGTWTEDPKQARDFKTSTDAVTFCAVHALRDSEPVMELEDRQFGLLPFSLAVGRYDQPLNDF